VAAARPGRRGLRALAALPLAAATALFAYFAAYAIQLALTGGPQTRAAPLVALAVMNLVFAGLFVAAGWQFVEGRGDRSWWRLMVWLACAAPAALFVAGTFDRWLLVLWGPYATLFGYLIVLSWVTMDRR
jgi:hypothetical protein